MVVHDPGNPKRDEEAAWWETGKVADEHATCQRHFDRYPGTHGPTWRDAPRGGIEQTLSYLFEVQEDPEVVAAVLIAGSLFSRLGSSRAYYPPHWPSRAGVRQVLEMAYERWALSAPAHGWHYSCTTVLPFENNDHESEFRTIRGLIRYLAEEHASVLLKYQLVRVQFGPEPDPFIAAKLRNEREQQTRLREQYQAKWHQESEERARALTEMRMKHPRYGEWDQIGRERLRELVWTKPRTEIAREFGISDVAIGKLCKRLDVSAPPVGFWAKVQAGKLPHPNGVPPADHGLPVPPLRPVAAGNESAAATEFSLFKRGDKAPQKRADTPGRSKLAAMTRADLTAKVWSMPLTKLGAELEVTPAAIIARCEELGLARPKSNFWTQVDIGRVPHPRGAVNSEWSQSD